MKVTIHKIRVETVEVELPDTCPECSANFRTKTAALTELQYVASDQKCRIVDGKQGPHLDTYLDYDASEVTPDPEYVIGYRCSCGHVLRLSEATS